MEDKWWEMVYNSLIIMAKQFIHRCRFINARPLFLVLMNELTNFKKALKCIKTKPNKPQTSTKNTHILISDYTFAYFNYLFICFSLFYCVVPRL